MRSICVIGVLLLITPCVSWGKDGHWAWEAPSVPKLPAEAKVGSPRAIDHFIQRKLKEVDLTPAREASRSILLRRLALDLTGIPPTPDEVKAFVEDQSPDAIEKVVDRLLASPAYGEKWASKWLDLARYADTHGYESDRGREMWRFRDWVIAALNGDMPYDQFTIEQIAGDLLPDATSDQILATAFHRNTMTNGESGTDDEEFRSVAVVDRVNTTLQVWMGLTASCAACHDHKYDPLSQREYYQLYAIFNQTEDHDAKDMRPTVPTPTMAQRERLAKLQEALKAATEESEEAKKLKEQIQKLEKEIPKTPVMRERPKDQWRKTHIHVRGNFRDKGEEVQAAFPVAFSWEAPRERPSRLALARWLVDRKNPLTARVAVNRLWEELFGIGLVETSEDFGTQGEKASHPALLDYLAVRFMDLGWSQKKLLREIVLSHTYRQSAKVTSAQLEIDPRNRLLSRAPRFRLSAELIRDQALAASGLLSRKMYGRSVMPPQPAGLWKEAFSREAWKNSEGENRYRRGLYTYWKRTSPYPSMIAFDATSREVCAVRRIRTNTPLAAMVALNDPVFQECAQELARRVMGEGGDSVESRTRYAFQLVLARAPTDGELTRLMAFFEAERMSFGKDEEGARKTAESMRGKAPGGMEISELAAWTMVARVLLNLDETLCKP